MGKVDESHRTAAVNIEAFAAEDAAHGLDAVVINTSGCGTTVKDYGHMFEGAPLAESQTHSGFGAGCQRSFDGS